MKAEVEVSKDIAKALLEVKAVFLRPDDMFTWASGIKSPIYCDNRITLSHPKIRNLIKDSFVKMIETKFPAVEYVAGVATAGIPHAALIADALNLPLIYVRGASKDHGRENLIEGDLRKGAKVVVIEDLISTGSSVINAVHNLQAASADVLGLLAIFDYRLAQSIKNFSALDLPYYSLSGYDELIEVALDRGYVEEKDLEFLKQWRNSLN
jgi:orotate phosphoribosyltransferase